MSELFKDIPEFVEVSVMIDGPLIVDGHWRISRCADRDSGNFSRIRTSGFVSCYKVFRYQDRSKGCRCRDLGMC